MFLDIEALVISKCPCSIICLTFATKTHVKIMGHFNRRYIRLINMFLGSKWVKRLFSKIHPVKIQGFEQIDKLDFHKLNIY